MKLSIIIPSVNDPYLQSTVDDIRANAKTDPEIIVVFDGVKGKVAGAKAIYISERMGMRNAINVGVANSKSDYIIKTDEHCMFGENFDVKLIRDYSDDHWVMIPRRYKLDVEKWEVINEPPIDYEKLVVRPEKISGVYWSGRREQRKNIMLDETMVFQGSFYLMSRKHWDWLGGLQEEGYGPFAQEAIEIALKTWLGGKGKVITNKNTWYAHRHRDFRRAAKPWGISEGNAYSKDFWMNNRWNNAVHDWDWLMERFGLKS
ncbi:MAG: hypothetical protein A3C30_03095 [Candidatus Levybacteria bacterium RIFCSPHIGHO2_02_FULL_40_18]|nr:MAG: hypothetical protein A2869_04845 [Candidatus Levybacteria bacterium RIFCSPHIGHO2_01_FULL_40_58]OGH26539.1 MAG: hypothetical protein A3C30_03095 [Candidatus Levybacteria bacterium RIFCSPHIGHO2_02_FULL_40_18]OGH31528.1 MAG: hypothetical protein A3E43_02185 [Candidatus Levybacteria bacterium RIFCSPHIGHO2_12_FULL_40_31]OGH40293.1 MAG: hypothetical protein A2894_00735 [Candidatus Levybacteria bacterium RIFCSPLOWO2_01_FULL_40_64]OGH49497.1 MAG: hypothetical protein A3I54_03145 [Candidatus Lev